MHDSEPRKSARARVRLVVERLTLGGPNPALPQRYRGKVVLDLDDASLVALPVFREIDRFLGAARGGLFEDGDLLATIANRQLLVDMFTLEGRLVQLHATGTVGFDGQLNLEVLINTNQIIPETGRLMGDMAYRLGEFAIVTLATAGLGAAGVAENSGWPPPRAARSQLVSNGSPRGSRRPATRFSPWPRHRGPRATKLRSGRAGSSPDR